MASPASSTLARAPRNWGLNFDLLCLVLALLPIALRVLLIPVPPHDFWWHLAQGETIWNNRAVPQFDSWSWTRNGAPYFNQSWLAQVLFYAQFRLGGLPLLILSQTVAVTFSYALLAHSALQRARFEKLNSQLAVRSVALGLLLLTLVCFDNWLLRPQTLAIPVFAAWVWSLNAWRCGQKRALWLLPILMTLWVNLHGSFVLGLILCALSLISVLLQQRKTASEHLQVLAGRDLAMWSAFAAFCVLLNPRGVQVLGYVKMMLFDASNRFSSEWLSPTPRNFNDALFFAFCLLLCGVFIYARRKLDRTDALWLAVFFWLGITSGRYIMWFAMIALAPLVLALCDREIIAKPEVAVAPNSRKINAILAIALWSMLLPLLPMWKASLGLPPALGALTSEETPIAATQFLRSLPSTQRPRRLWHNAPSGSYLVWAARDENWRQRVWIDTRFELYPPQQWRDYLKISSGENISEITEKYRIDAFLIDRKAEAALLQVLADDRQHKEVYRDARFVILLKR